MSVKIRVQSLALLSGLRLQHRCKLRCRLQIAARILRGLACGIDHSCCCDSTTSSGTSICRRCSLKKKQNNNNKKNYSLRNLQIYNTVLTMATMLHMTLPGHICPITGRASLRPPSFVSLTSSLTSGNYQRAPWIYEFISVLDATYKLDPAAFTFL